MTAKKNFNIFYEIDGEEVGSVLRVDEYGGDEHFSWVMLWSRSAEGARAPPRRPRALLQGRPEGLRNETTCWVHWCLWEFKKNSVSSPER